jgi:hypothetical protein
VNAPKSPLYSLIGYYSLLLAAMLAAGCSFNSNAVVGSDKPATENRPVGVFSKIKVEGAESLDVEIGNTTAVTVTTDDNLLPLVETRIEGDTLRISSVRDYRTKLGVKIKITTPALEGVVISGACDMQARDLDAKDFALDISGAGSAHLAGKTVALEINISGVGSIDTSGLPAQKVKVDISGTGRAVVCATESLDATVTGAGSVSYTGHPAQVRKNVSGVGSIEAAPSP